MHWTRIRQGNCFFLGLNEKDGSGKDEKDGNRVSGYSGGGHRKNAEDGMGRINAVLRAYPAWRLTPRVLQDARVQFFSDAQILTY